MFQMYVQCSPSCGQGTCIAHLLCDIISLFVVTLDPQKPLWLEMQNVVPTALHQTPTRLILKLGDDLRQDMITLKMFSLFEKVHILSILEELVSSS